MPVEARALRRRADPSAAGHALAGPERAQIIDFMTGHDPDIGRFMRGRRDRTPMGGGDILNPPHPGRIVHMAELVDLGLRCGEAAFERCHESRGLPFAARVKATWARVKREAISAAGSDAP